MMNRLLDRLYRAFDRDSDAATALRISHPAGAAWKVERHRLTVATEAGAPLASVSLRTGTIDQVAAALVAAGVAVIYQRPGFGARHASVLVAGSGSESESNGNAIAGHRSVLWGLLSAYAIELEDAGDRAIEAVKQAYLATAQGEWLDYWGGYFGVPRSAGLGDVAYLVRIIVETLRPRSNKFAIENTIFDYTGKLVEIHEPWKNIFILDRSKLSSDHRIKDGVTVGRNLIQPLAREPLDWSVVLPVIHANRAAGVIVLPPATRISVFSDAASDCFMGFALTRINAVNIAYVYRTRLDFNLIEDIPVLNYGVIHSRINGWRSYVSAGDDLVVHGRHLRSYRFYTSASNYPSQSWRAPFSWSGQSESWKTLTITFGFSHSRSSVVVDPAPPTPSIDGIYEYP